MLRCFGHLFNNASSILFYSLFSPAIYKNFRIISIIFISTSYICVTALIFHHAFFRYFHSDIALFLQDFIFIPSYIVEIHNFIPCLLCIFHELCVFSSLAASVIIATSSRDGQPQTSISCSVPKVRILPFFSFLPKTHDGGYAAVWPGCRVFFFFQKKKR